MDLVGLRGGGATALYMDTENAPYVQHVGRWANVKVMEMYLQELSAVTLIPSLPAVSRQRIAALADAASCLMQRAVELQAAAVPPSAWTALFASD